MNETLHRWTFTRIGGVDQVVFKSGEDIANLRDLEQKLWAVLTMPARQHLMRDTLEYLDADKDGRIRVPDILRAVDELQEALSKVKTLSGLLPICASCKKIRDDQGYWTQVEVYVRDHSDADFTHSICPECAARLYPGLYEGGS